MTLPRRKLPELGCTVIGRAKISPRCGLLVHHSSCEWPRILWPDPEQLRASGSRHVPTSVPRAGRTRSERPLAARRVGAARHGRFPLASDGARLV